jgi:glycosidase
MRIFFFFVFAMGYTPATLWAQAAHAQVPVIDKIDPPGWWTQFPDPMLLVHGENLADANFAVSGAGVQLTRTQISANGHWAFLWLQTKSAAAQTLWIAAKNQSGRARQSFLLADRSDAANAHAGLSSSDTLYLIMTDRFARGESSGDAAKEKAEAGASQGERDLPRGWHGGNLAGIERHIDYLKELGVTAVWTTPVVSNGAMPQSYHGYAATDLYAVDAHFGTLQDYQHLSDALHAKGMKLVIDLVPNHIGVLHPWVHDPPAPDWLHGTLEHHRATQSNFESLTDPHAAREAWSAITEGWFTDAMPDLNQENPLVASYLIENALWWVETANLDGIRLDTFPYVGRAFWHDFHAALHSVFPRLTTVGEVFNGDAEITSFFAGGIEHGGIDTGLDTPFDFPVYFTLRDVLNHGHPMTELARVLRQDSLYPHPERLVPFIGNHDTVRFLTDGNGSAARLKLALGLLTTLRGTPQIYSGDEIGMAGGGDPDNRRDFPGGFPGDARSAFRKAGRTPAEESIFAWTSGLLALRAAHPALQQGLEQDLYADENVFAFVRAPEGDGCSADHSSVRVLIVANKAESKLNARLPVAETALSGCTEFTAIAPTSGAAPVARDGQLEIEEAGGSLSIFEVR